MRLPAGARAGAAQAERQSPAAAAAVDHMPVEEAYEAMAAAHPLRIPVRDALYGYWRAKRERTGKPLIRRLQAPTSASDQNPYGVFRCARRDGLLPRTACRLLCVRTLHPCSSAYHLTCHQSARLDVRLLN